MNEPNDTSGIVPIKSEEELDAEIEEIIKEMKKLFDDIDWEALAKEEENTEDE